MNLGRLSSVWSCCLDTGLQESAGQHIHYSLFYLEAFQLFLDPVQHAFQGFHVYSSQHLYSFFLAVELASLPTTYSMGTEMMDAMGHDRTPCSSSQPHILLAPNSAPPPCKGMTG